MEQTVTKRFGVKPNPRPTNKALSEALNDAFAAASLRARGLADWCHQPQGAEGVGLAASALRPEPLRPRVRRWNVVWLASDLVRETGRRSGRPGAASHSTAAAVARALVDAYRRQAQSRATELVTMPYLPIHEVRAEAAFACRVTRALADLV